MSVQTTRGGSGETGTDAGEAARPFGRRSRRGTIGIWALSILITLAAVTYQRLVGPTRPVRGTVPLRAETVRFRLARSHGGPGDLNLRIRVSDVVLGGTMVFRRYRSGDAWSWQPLRREGDMLVGALPHQPPAGKIIYRIYLHPADIASPPPGELAPGPGGTLPPAPPGWTPVPASGPVVVRFRGAVPPVVLVPHVFLMFFGMLLSNRAGLEAFRRASRTTPHAFAALGLLILGGLVFGPMVQWYSFGEAWTGVPLGWDLTDNKTLIAVLAWAAAALLSLRHRRKSRVWVAGAALITLVIFSIPHSVLGSELDYSSMPGPGSGRIDSPASQ